MLLGHKPKNTKIKALKRAESTQYRHSRILTMLFEKLQCGLTL